MAAGKHQHLFAKSRHYVLQMSDSWLHRFCHPTGYRCKVPQLHSSDPFMQNLETGQRKRLQPWTAQAWPSCFLASVFHETFQDTSPLPYQRSLLCSDPAMSRCAVAWARLWRVHRVESYFGPPKLFQRNWLLELAISTFWSLSCGACPPEASKTRWSEPVASKVYNWYTAHGSHSWKHGSSFPSWNIKTSDIKGNIVQLQVSWPPNRGKRTGTNNDSDSRRCKMGRNHLKLDKALFISWGLFPFHSHGGEISRLGVAPSYLHNLGQPSEADSKSLKSHKTQNILWDPSPHLERLEVGPKCATSIRHLHLNQGLEDSWPTVTEIPCFELGTVQQSLLQKLQRCSVLANKILAMQFSALPHQPRATAICSICFSSLNKFLSRHCSCLHVYWILYNICTYFNTYIIHIIYTYTICLYIDINILYWLEKMHTPSTD